jgi:uncharacterized membrane protein YjjP (DUF1212 family)
MEEAKRCQSCGRKMRRDEDKGIKTNGKRSEDYCYMCFMNGNFTHPDITIEKIIEQGAKDWSEHDQNVNYEEAKKELSKIVPKLKRWKKPSKKAILVSGFIAGILAFLVDIVFFMNPLVSGIYSQYIDLIKPTNFVGWFFGIIFSTLLLALFYYFTEKAINIKSAWKKGLFFGFLFWLVSKLPVSYFIWLRFNYPDIIIIETLGWLINNVVAGISLAILYKKLK